MQKLFIAAAVVLFGFTSSAFAVDGRTAVGMCIDSTASGARCAWSVNDKGEIDICNKNGCVTCPGAEQECTVAARGRPRPRLTLPVGATIMTPWGFHRVTPRPLNLRALTVQQR